MPREAAWVAGFYPMAKLIRLYVNMATVPVWRPLDAATSGGTEAPCWEVTMVDLDLDVVLRWSPPSRRVWSPLQKARPREPAR